MKIVRKNIEIRIYPTNVDFNDNGEKIVSINKIESNIGINRFIYNKELEFINYFKDLLQAADNKHKEILSKHSKDTRTLT